MLLLLDECYIKVLCAFPPWKILQRLCSKSVWFDAQLGSHMSHAKFKLYLFIFLVSWYLKHVSWKQTYQRKPIYQIIWVGMISTISYQEVIGCLLCLSCAKELQISQEILFLFSVPCTLGEAETLSHTRNPLFKNVSFVLEYY